MSWINLLDIIYPVGSIYCSTLATSPAELLGGSWTKIEEAVLRSSDDAFGYTGTDSHAMTIEEMPNHKHGIKFPFTTQGNGYYAVWLGAQMGDSVVNDSVTSEGWVQKYGGGKKCLLSNVRSTAICGIELPKITSFWGGDLVWLG